MTATDLSARRDRKPPLSVIFGNPARFLTLVSIIWVEIRWLRLLVFPLVAVAATAMIVNLHVLTDSMTRVFTSMSFLQSMVFGLLTTNLLGRLSKGVAMAGYGLPPHQFGIRLLFGLIPRFYIPSRAVRTLPFPQQRRCYAAPMLTRLTIFAVGILGWLALRRGGSNLADLALAFGMTGLTVFLFTANPIWRADGYRWITAVLRIPNLAEQAFQLLRFLLTGRKRPEAMPPGRAKLLVGYAIVSVVYMSVFIWMVLSSAAIALEAEFGGSGVVMFCLLIGIVALYFSAMRSRRKNRGQRRTQQATMAMTASHSDDIRCTTTPEPERTQPSPPASEATDISKYPENRGRGRRPEAKEPERRPVDPQTTDPDLEDILPPMGAETVSDDDDLFRLFDEDLADPKPPAETPPKDPAGVPARREVTQPAAVVPPPLPAEPRASDQLDKVLGVGTAKRAKTPLWRKLLIWTVLIGALFFAAQQPYAFSVGGEFIVQSVARTQVRARTDGEIVELFAREGDWVEEDAVLAVLSKWDEERDIAVLEAELEKQRADLATLTAGPKPEEIALAEQSRAAAAAELAAAEEDLSRSEQLFNSGTIARKMLDDARTRQVIAEAELERAIAALALLQAPVLDSEVDAARAAITRTEQELIFHRLKLEHTNIRAVSSGQIVSTLSGVSVGTFLREGDLFAELADNRTVLAEIEVPETEIDEVAVGAEVTLKPWSDPDSGLIGTVKRIAPAAEERQFGRIMRVVVEVPNPDGTLAGNMTGFGKIAVDERPAWQAFTRAVIRFFQIELWSWLP